MDQKTSTQAFQLELSLEFIANHRVKPLTRRPFFKTDAPWLRLATVYIRECVKVPLESFPNFAFLANLIV
jgi:hypothetical protein